MQGLYERYTGCSFAWTAGRMRWGGASYAEFVTNTHIQMALVHGPGH